MNFKRILTLIIYLPLLEGFIRIKVLLEFKNEIQKIIFKYYNIL